MQTILAQAKTEANELKVRESPFAAASKFSGRIMVNMESVQQLQPYKGS